MINHSNVAVIFASTRTDGDDEAYAAMIDEMVTLVQKQDGFLGATSVADPTTRQEITVSYWRDDNCARAWKQVAEHQVAQHLGRSKWYSEYSIVVAEVTRSYSFGQSSGG